MGERHHVAGALDQRVPRARHVPQDGLADGVIHGGGLRSLEYVDRRGHSGERVKCDQVVEENVPQVSLGLLDGEKRLAARGRPPRK